MHTKRNLKARNSARARCRAASGAPWALARPVRYRVQRSPPPPWRGPVGRLGALSEAASYPHFAPCQCLGGRGLVRRRSSAGPWPAPAPLEADGGGSKRGDGAGGRTRDGPSRARPLAAPSRLGLGRSPGHDLGGTALGAAGTIETRGQGQCRDNRDKSTTAVGCQA